MVAPDILYVEDDSDFAFIMEHAVQEINKGLTIRIIDNGRDAMSVLKLLTEGKNKPKLILLDLNLPGLSGVEILKKIREIPYLKYTPVVFLSTSDDPLDVKSSLEYGANAFLTKPAGYLNLVSCIESLYDFWFIRHLNLN